MSVLKRTFAALEDSETGGWNPLNPPLDPPQISNEAGKFLNWAGPPFLGKRLASFPGLRRKREAWYTLHRCLCACVKNNRIFPVYHIVNARGEYSRERIRRSQTLCKQVRWLVTSALSSVKQAHIVHTLA